VTAHKVGDQVTIRWPGGPHDYVIEYYDDGLGTQPPPSKGFQYIRGVVVQPDGLQWRTLRTFYVRQVGDGYELLPLRR
jgi:hypothetical protein